MRVPPSLILSVFSALNSILSLAIQIVFAYKVGPGPELDAYYLGINLPLLVSCVVVGTINTRIVTLLTKSPESFGSVIRTGTIAGLLCILTGILIAPISVQLFAPTNWTEIQKSVAIATTQFLWSAIAFQIITSIFNARMQVAGKFTLQGVAAMFPYIGNLLASIYLFSYWGISAAAFGLFVGFIVQCVLTVFLQMSSMSVAISEIKLFGKLSAIPSESYLVALSFLAFSTFSVLDSLIVPIMGDSILSYFSFGQRITVAVGSTISAGVITTIFPQLIKRLHDGTSSNFGPHLRSRLQAVFLVSVLVTTLLVILREPVIALLFQRGNFHTEDVDLQSKIIIGFLMGMPVSNCCVVVARAIFASASALRAAAFGCLVTIIYGVVLYSLALTGVAYIASCAYTVSWVLALILAYLLLRKDLRPKLPTSVWLGKVIFAVTATAVVSWCIKLANRFHMFWSHPFFEVALVGFFGILTFILVGWLLKIDEFGALYKRGASHGHQC